MRAKKERKLKIMYIPQAEILSNSALTRKRFDFDALEGLAESIRENGMLQPILVRQTPDKLYQIVAGERRLRAARVVGIEKIPCIVLQATDAKAARLSFLENVHRKNLDCFEQAEAVRRIISEHGMTVSGTAEKLGVSAQSLVLGERLLQVPEDLRGDFLRAGFTRQHALALLRIGDEDTLRLVTQTAVQRGLSQDDTEALVEQVLYRRAGSRKPVVRSFKDLRLFTNSLTGAVNILRKAGLSADSTQLETDEYIEYIVRIQKNEAPMTQFTANAG
jgi:ParB family chromosome partitioning protein